MIDRKLIGPITTTLIILNVLLYLPLRDSTTFGCSTYFVVTHHQYYRLITSMFAHGSIAHLISNMIALGSIGSVLDKQLSPGKYAVAYFVTGIAGSFLSFYLRNEFIISIGASAAIYGLYGVMVTYLGNKEYYKDIALNFILIVLIGFLIPYIDMWAHLGGLVCGLVLGKIYKMIKYASNSSSYYDD